MTEHYDTLETRQATEREAELFARLPDVLRKAMAAPAYAERLTAIEAGITGTTVDDTLTVRPAAGPET